MQISGPLWMSAIFGVLLEQLVCVLLIRKFLGSCSYWLWPGLLFFSSFFIFSLGFLFGLLCPGLQPRRPFVFGFSS